MIRLCRCAPGVPGETEGKRRGKGAGIHKGAAMQSYSGFPPAQTAANLSGAGLRKGVFGCMTSFEIMRPEERLACADLAARAFEDYEYFSVYVADDKRRRRFLRALLRSEFRSNRDSALFFTAKTDGVAAGVAMLCAPGYRKPSDVRYLRTGYLAAMLHGGIRNVDAWNEMEKQAGAPCHSLADGAWYLSLLTVEPAQEGQGIGSGMLRECLVPYVREHGGSSLCLFTNSRRNCIFYQKNGFTEFDARQFSYNGKKIGSWSYRKAW